VATYPWRGGPLALELANTVFAQDGEPRDALTTKDELASWLDANATSFADHARAAASGQLERFRELRDAVRELLRSVIEATEPPAAAIQHVNELSAAAPRFPRLAWICDQLDVELVTTAPAGAEVLAIVARATIALLGGRDRERLRVCAAPGCVLFFLQKRRRRDWCSSACGNRGRVARHYRRHRSAAARVPGE
jgi:predicted RNA-binding Zn ribbon-like protein